MVRKIRYGNANIQNTFQIHELYFGFRPRDGRSARPFDKLGGVQRKSASRTFMATWTRLSVPSLAKIRVMFAFTVATLM
ncbi:hypothetical protein SAMN05216276_106315 [Streptosporangium subroseum]|uniref:Uncharacterized protein n=1 Tax=Streptosporangium subroseum TaxID=106412 RepID=A0A239NN58_9ACTN|nr:hypothetical protein SAMN05216276_106315 [Streptosporangium subroseum]